MLAFIARKKDQCDFCQKFLAAEGDQKDSKIEQMEQHLKNKNLARQIKESHKARA